MPLILLIILTSISCKNRNQLEIEFENQLPETDQITLDRIVNSYDNFIRNEFKGDTHQFLSRIETAKQVLSDSIKQEYCELARMFDESTLEFKSQNVKYDSVYVSESGSIIRIQQPEDISEDELQIDEEISILPSGRTIEEEIEEIKNRGYWRFISASSFTTALSKTVNENIEIMKYVDAKDAVGHLNPQRMAASILESEIDVDNYFIKRIIALELYIKQIKSEYGCQ